MHRLLELVLIPVSHPHLTSPHPWAPWMAHQSHTGRNHTSPHMINSIYLPWTCFFISLAGSSHVCKRIKTFTVYQTFQKHHRKLQIAKNTGKKKKTIFDTKAAMETGEMVHFSLLLLQAVVSVGIFPTIHLPGTHKEAGGTRGEKKAEY